MLKKILLLACVSTWVLNATTYGEVIVTLEASDAAGQPVAGTVSVGDTLTVEVFLATDAASEPLMDLRGIQLDFSASSPELEVSSFVWLLEPEQGDFLYVQFVNLPSPGVAYTGMSRSEGLILDLTAVPMRVASFDVIVAGAGTLNVVGSVEEGFTAGGSVQFNFVTPVTFSVFLGDLTGGTLDVSVGGDGGSGGGSGGGTGGGGAADMDSDGDGVVDSADAFPDDPTETTDTDGDGVGDVADVFPDDPTQTGVDTGDGGSGADGGTGSAPGGSGVPPVCGAGAAPSMIFMLSVLGFVRGRRRFGVSICQR